MERRLNDEYALVGATLIDGNGGEPVADSSVVVRNGRIAQVGTVDTPIPRSLKRIVLDGFTLLPGLIDSHVHFTGVASCEPIDWMIEPNLLEAIRSVAEVKKVLEYGFTTVRSAGSRYDLYLRQAVEEGVIPGPRIRACGLGPCRTGGHGDPAPRDRYQLPEGWSRTSLPWAQPCDGVEDLRKLIRTLISQNVDHIKFWATGGGFWARDRLKDTHYTKEEMDTIVQEAHMCGLKVMCHAENVKAIRWAVDLGVDSIEHGDNEDGEVLDEDTCRKMAERNIFLCPLLSINFAEPDCMQALPDNVIAGYRRAVKHGVKILMGSDAYASPVTPYGSFNIREISSLVRLLGFTPLEAITSATKLGAEACDLAGKTGSIEVGKWADLLIVRQDPTLDIDILLSKDDIVYVIKEGQMVIDNGGPVAGR